MQIVILFDSSSILSTLGESESMSLASDRQLLFAITLVRCVAVENFAGLCRLVGGLDTPISRTHVETLQYRPTGAGAQRIRLIRTCKSVDILNLSILAWRHSLACARTDRTSRSRRSQKRVAACMRNERARKRERDGREREGVREGRHSSSYRCSPAARRSTDRRHSTVKSGKSPAY